jgi:MFS transporter, SP family, solute carrier family 2 (facilitated glucose transporter), member 12
MEKGKDPLAPAPSDGERATTPPAANDDDSGATDAPHGDAMAGPPKLWPPPKSLTPITNRENPAAIDKAMKIFAVKVAVIGSVGGVLFGYDLGVVSGALLQLSARFDLQRPEEKGLVVSILLAGSVCGALIGGCFTDRYGRRLAIMCTDLIFIVGSFTIATSPTLTQVLIGRFAVGIGVSVSAIADVAYLNEMAPQKWRGIIVSVNEMMIAGGFLLGASRCLRTLQPS